VLESRYEKFSAFKKLIREYDPNGKFNNEFLHRNIYGS